MHSGMKCKVGKLVEAWFNKHSLTKIFSFADLVNKYRIKYDSKIEDAFWVYVDNKEVKFKRIANRIYGFCLVTTDDDQKQLLQMQLIYTVDRKIFFTKRQQAGANRARELFNLVGCRSVEDIKAAIQINLIKIIQLTMNLCSGLQIFVVHILSNWRRRQIVDDQILAWMQVLTFQTNYLKYKRMS